ncbi:MAG: zinc-dependent metalloprotease [Acidimicrobiales bacterium]
MSGGPAFPGGGPLGDLLRDLARLLTAQGPINWEVAQQLAAWTATGGEVEPNPDPLARIRTEELMRVADMHVAETVGMPTSRRGWLGLRCVTRAEWASATLTSWREVFSTLATALNWSISGGEAGAPGGPRPAPEGGEVTPPPGGSSPMDQLLGNLPQVIGPLLLGAQAGTMVGNLANRASGQYDMPVPAPATDELMVVPTVIDGFAAEWGLAPDHVRMYICLRDVAHHAVLIRPHVDAALRAHLLAYAGAFRASMDALEEHLSGLDPTDPMSFQQSLGDPETFLGDIQTDEQRRMLVPFRAFLSALSGYTDFVLDKVGRRLVGSFPLINEAFHRRRLEEGPGQRVLAKLFGLELDQGVVEKGHAFVAGVLERAGEQALARLWEGPVTLPTPAEVDAPGLWLARIELMG